jgi:2-succinyl-6-hydroxy-2,4-cyclohexadiene-1-carboxylate synthase
MDRSLRGTRSGPTNLEHPVAFGAMSAPSLAASTIGTGERVVLLHGFTQTGRCWGPLAGELAADHEVVTVDLPGHGGSSAIHASIEDSVELLADVGGPATYLGYSMGGRFALRLALDRPDIVRRLVLIGASPGLADADERAARRASDEALADRVGTLGVEAFVHEWLDLPLFAGIHAAMRFEAERCTNTAAGLASSLRLAGTGAQEPLWDRLGELRAPTLLITGGDDTKFTAINAEIDERVESAEHTVVRDSGHTVHLEYPAATTALMKGWLRRTSR